MVLLFLFEIKCNSHLLSDTSTWYNICKIWNVSSALPNGGSIVIQRGANLISSALPDGGLFRFNSHPWEAGLFSSVLPNGYTILIHGRLVCLALYCPMGTRFSSRGGWFVQLCTAQWVHDSHPGEAGLFSFVLPNGYTILILGRLVCLALYCSMGTRFSSRGGWFV